ncbi:MAG: hypothetical protein AB7N71_09195 [Phycisphaerae bacterium]
MDPGTTQFAQRLRQAIQQLRGSVRRALLTRGFAAVLVAIVGFTLLQLVLDRWFQLSVDQRVILNILITAVWVWVTYRFLLRPLSKPISDSQVASWVDRANPELHDLTKTAVEFREREGEPVIQRDVSGELVALTLKDAEARLDRAAFDRVLDRGRLRRNRQWLVGGLVLSILPWVVFPTLMGIWFSRNWLLRDVAWPQQTYIEPVDFEASNRRRMARGDSVSISAVVRGEMPRQATLQWRTQDGQTGAVNMIRTGDDRLVADLGVLTQEIEFRIVGNDERTQPFVLVPVERPRITDSVVRISPPAYVDDPAQVLARQTNVELLAGSSLAIEVGLNKPVTHARFIDTQGADVGSTAFLRDGETGALRIVTNLNDPQSGTYEYSLVDADGIESANPVRFVFRVRPDEAPEVELVTMGASDVLTPIAEIPVRVTFSDAYGISSATLTAQRNSQAPQTILAPHVQSRQRRLEASSAVLVQNLAVLPGDTLRLRSTAEDIDPRGPNIGMSPEVNFRVISLDDFRLVLAQREQELRSEFERLLANQRALKVELTQVFEAIGEPTLPEAREVRRLEAISRKQSSYGTRCGAFAERYESLVEELRVNKVGRVAEERRVLDRIVRPLRLLQDNVIPRAASELRTLSQSAPPEVRESCLNMQDRVLREMMFVFQNMLEGEGYREVLSSLQDIIGEQEAIHRDTEAKVSSLLDDILGLTEPASENQPAPAPPIE